MNSIQKTQRGASAIVVIIILAIIGAGAYIGLQYIPQYIEAGTVDSILDNIERANNRAPVTSTNAIRDMINKQLNMNQLNDLGNSFKITRVDDEFVIEVSYERELNLIYKKEPVKYEKTLTLKGPR
jgi:Tfp pilus assembly major pilin PilA